ncbi:hypothetical protein SteCoe_35947 [Stentor coeruleus]|uniref:Uncharacterized protein n=1 Tax=Stentor coeruleus TaxID=5963 RepID=A0A1R2ARG9_9CILI|nr:hypothetical protein SteCoe_35947 [Stentor coeruleus]
MAASSSVKVLAKFSQSSRVSQEEVEMFDTSNRIVAYAKKDNKVEVYYNQDYAQVLKEKFTEITKFYTKFYVLEEIFLDICRLKEIIDVEKAHALNYIDTSLKNVDNRIDGLKNDIDEARKNEIKIKKDQKREESTLINENRINKSQKQNIIGIRSSTAADHLMNSTRVSEMNRAKKIAEVHEIYKIYPENIKLLEEQKAFLMNDMKADFEKNFKIFLRMWKKIGKFYQQIQKMGNPLEGTFEFDFEELNVISSSLISCLQQLHKTRLILFTLEQEVALRDKLVDINEKIGLKKIEISGEVAAAPYIDAQIECHTNIYNETRGRYIAIVTNDRVDHMSYCIKEINHNIDELTNDINSISGYINPPNTLVIQSNSRTKAHTSPDAFSKSPETRVVEEEMLTTHRNKVHYEGEKKKLPSFLAELANLENIKKGFFLEKNAMYEEKNQIFLNIADSYGKLLGIISENTALHYDSSMLICLLSVLIKYVNVAKKPGCCSFGSVDDYLAVDITATQIFEILSKILGKGKKVKTGCCSGDDLHKVFTCNSIDLNDLIDLLLNVRVLGAFIGDNGEKQKVANKRRTESINHSIIGSIKEFIHVYVLQNQYLFDNWKYSRIYTCLCASESIFVSC